METQRLLLYLAFGFLCLIIYQTWLQDYHTPAPTVQTSTDVPGATPTAVDTLPAAPGGSADLPAAVAGSVATPTATEAGVEILSLIHI